MRTTYIANITEAANLHSGKQTAIVTLVKPQPHIDESGHIKQGDWNYGKTLDDKPAFENFAKCKSTYQPGQKIAVRETWAETCDEYGGSIIVFKSTNKAFYIGPKFEILWECTAAWDIDNYPACGKWRSPVTMPREAVRTRLLVKDVACIRVQDMTSEQAQAIWPDMSNIERMQDLHRRFGQSAWGNNVFVFITKVEKI